MTSLYMLDTSIASELIRNPNGRAAQRARRMGDAVCVSIVVAAELRFGSTKKGSASLQRQVDQLLRATPVLPLEVPVDAAYAAIRTQLESVGRPIGSNDLLIAAHALALDAVLVTANVGEFQRVSALVIENWTT